MASPLLKRPRAAAAWLLAPQLPAVARGSRGLQPSASEKGGSSSRSSSQPPAIARSERQRILWRCKKESACLGSTPERVRDRRKDRQAGQGRDAPEKHAIVSGRSPRRKPGDSAWRRRPFSIQGNVAASGRMSMASGMMFTPGVPGLPPGASWCCAWHPATQPNGSRDRRKLEELCSRKTRHRVWKKPPAEAGGLRVAAETVFDPRQRRCVGPHEHGKRDDVHTRCPRASARGFLVLRMASCHAAKR